MCVCVCDREREIGERERETETERDRERQREKDRCIEIKNFEIERRAASHQKSKNLTSWRNISRRIRRNCRTRQQLASMVTQR